jgi:hypothetical protein
MAVTATAVVTLATGGNLAAQERPRGLLNELDVQTLVARGEPADDARLFVHFRVLSDRYETAAERHESMARSFVGNPNRSSGSGMSEHCTRLADSSRQSAATLRELAKYHKRLSEGTPAVLPRHAARFQGGADAPEPTETELAKLAAQARTRSDHLELEEYLRTLARRYIRNANEHMTLALTYRGGRFAHAAVHHEHLANVARQAAREVSALAARHRQYTTLGL